MPRGLALLFVLAAVFPGLALAETVSQRNGTDTFLSGTAALPEMDSPGDVFAVGQSVVLKGRAVGDVHAAGFDVSIEVPAPADLYAMGATVAVLAPVGGDLTAAGMTVRTASLGEVAGNARLAGATVVVDGAVKGALAVSAGEVTLNATVGGDVLMVAGTASFGPNARILGQLVYAATKPLEVPSAVIPPDRVTFRQLEVSDAVTGLPKGDFPVLPAVRTAAAGVLVTLAFLVLVAAILLAFAPVTADRMRRTIDGRPGTALLAGVFGLSALFGLVPVSMLTIIGIPLLPFAVLVLMLGWMLAYLLGLYAVALRLARGFGMAEGAGLAARVVLLALALLVAAALNFIPVLGWVVNVALMLLGAGGIVLVLLRSPAAAAAGTEAPA